MSIKLIEGWHRIASRLWSIRLSLLAALLSALEVGFSLYATGSAPIIVMAACIISIGAAVARIVAQPKVTNEQNDQ